MVVSFGEPYYCQQLLLAKGLLADQPLYTMLNRIPEYSRCHHTKMTTCLLTVSVNPNNFTRFDLDFFIFANIY